MALKEKVITLFNRYGAPVKFATNLILNAFLPGSPAVIDLVNKVLDCCTQTAKDQPDFDEKKLPASTAEDLKRVEEVLDVISGDLQTVVTQVTALQGLPDAAKKILEAALQTDERCHAALKRLDAIGRRFDRLEQQNRRILDGQGYAAGMIEEMLPLMRRYGQVNFGNMHQNGWGVPQNHNEAVKWYRKAADQGNAEGQNCLGIMYQHGRGVPRDHFEAVKLYRMAVAQGLEQAKQRLKDLGVQ